MKSEHKVNGPSTLQTQEMSRRLFFFSSLNVATADKADITLSMVSFSRQQADIKLSEIADTGTMTITLLLHHPTINTHCFSLSQSSFYLGRS